jgi:NAD(P)-dependent dehydrogenase (short-subunit alcohol dehydrogenase family)
MTAPGRTEPNRALVTGGAGFIGSHLVDSLLAGGWDVSVIDSFDPFYPAAVKQANIEAHRRHPRWRLYELDIADDARLDGVPGTFDVVVHLAAKAGVRPPIRWRTSAPTSPARRPCWSLRRGAAFRSSCSRRPAASTASIRVSRGAKTTTYCSPSAPMPAPR